MPSPDPPSFTRRDILWKLGAATALVGFCPMLGREARAGNSDEDGGSSNDHGTATVRNAAIEFSVSISQGRVISRSFLNRDSGERFTLPVDDVALKFLDEG